MLRRSIAIALRQTTPTPPALREFLLTRFTKPVI
jgi:hypothetical protein